MSRPLVISIPHRLGRAEAERRLRTGLGRARSDFANLFTIDEERWQDSRLFFRIRALAQTASGSIDVLDDELRLEVTLPWLLGKFAERLVPAIRREATLLIEKK